MANTPPNLIAGGTIRPSRFVKIDTGADDSGLESDANEDTIGVSHDGSNQPPLSDLVSTNNAAIAGQHFRLFGDGDICLLEAGAAVANGERLKSDADGKGIPILLTGTTVQRYGAKAMETAAADGDMIRVQVLSGLFLPAAS